MGMGNDRMVGRVRECMEILNGISPEQALNYTGDIYQTYGFQPHWATASPPQIYVGANQPQMLHMAAGVADRIMLGDPTPARLETCMRDLDAHLESHGRNRADVQVSALIAWHVKEDAAASFSEAKSQLALRGMLDDWYLEGCLDADERKLVASQRENFFTAYKQGSDSIEGVPDSIVDKLVEHLTMAGGPDAMPRHTETLLQYQALGLDEVAFKLHRDHHAAITTIGEQLLPQVGSV